MVGGEVPDVNGATLVPHNEGGLVWVETHAVHRSIHLEEPLTLLAASSGGGRRGKNGACVYNRRGRREGEGGEGKRGEGGRRGEGRRRGKEGRRGREGRREPLPYLRSHILAIQSSPPEYM